MSTKFEAMVVRYTPAQGLGEALNVAVVMRTDDGKLFNHDTTKNWKRVAEAFPDVDEESLRENVRALIRAVDAVRSEVGNSTKLQELLRVVMPTLDGSLQVEFVAGATSAPSAAFQRLRDRYLALGDNQRKRIAPSAPHDFSVLYKQTIEHWSNSVRAQRQVPSIDDRLRGVVWTHRSEHEARPETSFGPASNVRAS